MPFTFSHPAVVLPFNYLSKRWISLTALVIGSITPDFEYFIRMKVASYYSHYWTGLFWFDLPLGLLLLLIYNQIVKDKLIDHLPSYFNKRLSPFKNSAIRYSGSYLIIIIVCILIGAASHIFWDSFTHPAGYFVKHIHLLSHRILVGSYAISFYNIVQHLSSLTGAVIILYAIVQLPSGKSTKNNNIITYWIKILVVTLFILIIRLLTGLKLHEYGDMIVTAISGILIGLILASAITPAKQTA
jgi:hypothetical protein